MLKRLGLLGLLIAFSSATSHAQEAIAEAKVVGNEPTEATRAKAARPLTVSAEVVGDVKFTGTLVDSSSLQMKTAFGEAQIPLTEVAGVRFASGDDTSTTVVMLNGDSITGATETKFVTIETEWGSAKINGSSLTSLLFVPGLQWQSSTSINGKRWSLIEGKPAARPNLNVAPTRNPLSSAPGASSAAGSSSTNQGSNASGQVAPTTGAANSGARAGQPGSLTSNAQGATLQGTVLQGTTLQGANLQGAVLPGTVLQGSLTPGAVLSETVVPGSLAPSVANPGLGAPSPFR